MAYNANIPQPGDQISQSQADILANFQATGAFVAIDHAGFNTADAGKHNKITFPEQAGAPAAMAATEIGLYNIVNPVTTFNELYIRQNQGGTVYDTPLTACLAATPGWTYLPSGLILKWGTSTLSLAGTVVAFNPVFPHACLTVSLTARSDGGQNNFLSALNLLPGSFTGYSTTRSGGASNAPVYYLAIGW